MASSRFGLIIGTSIAVHAGIAIWALCGDPPVERPVLAATSGRIFIPDEVLAQYTFDASSLPAIAPPAPSPVPTPSPVAPPTAPAPSRPGRPHRDPAQLREPSAKNIVDGLFADEHGLAPAGEVARRTPGADLQRQIDDARRKNGSAQIGNADPRFRGDALARTGTAPDCACDPTLAPTTVPTVRPETPPVIVVRPRAPKDPVTTLTAADVLRIVTTQYMAGLQRCQHELLRREGSAGGKVSLALTIDAGGAIAAVAADGVDEGLDRCIEARAGAWRFPAPRDPASGAATSAQYRLSLAMQAE